MAVAPDPLLVGIGGPSGAGKTVLAEALQHRLGDDHAEIIPLDAYYLNHDTLDLATRAGLNFDSPDAFDWPLLKAHIETLRQGGTIHRPVYDYATHSRSPATVVVERTRYIVIEGVLALYDSEVRDQMDVCVYVECDQALCLQRRIDRDVQERGRTRDSVIRQYENTVKPMFEKYVIPTKQYANIVVRGDQDISQSVDAIIRHFIAS